MDEKPKTTTLDRIAAVCAVTVIFGMLSCAAPADPPGGGEIFLAALVVAYGAVSIGIGRGLLDSWHTSNLRPTPEVRSALETQHGPPVTGIHCPIG